MFTFTRVGLSIVTVVLYNNYNFCITESLIINNLITQSLLSLIILFHFSVLSHFIVVTPELSSVPQEVLSWPGVSRKFTCSAKGNPLPEFHWYKGVYPLSSNKTYSIDVAKGLSTINVSTYNT